VSCRVSFDDSDIYPTYLTCRSASKPDPGKDDGSVVEWEIASPEPCSRIQDFVLDFGPEKGGMNFRANQL
jgi:hypothetical protein